jgi:hypothetical protein
MIDLGCSPRRRAPLLHEVVTASLWLVTLVTVAGAQPVSDPRRVEFVPSSDHNTTLSDGRPAVSGYLFEVYQAGAPAPFHSLDMAKPSPQTDGLIRYDFSGSLSAWPLPSGPYESRVTAVGPLGVGRSAASNQFTLSAPGRCASTLAPTTVSAGAVRATKSISVTTREGCSWTASSGASWVTASPASGQGSGDVTLTMAANRRRRSRSGTVEIAGQTVQITQAGSGDAYAPSTYSYFLAEGATGEWFDTMISLANPSPDPVEVALRFLTSAGNVVEEFLMVPGLQHVHLNPKSRAALARAEFSVAVEANGPLAVDRTMGWGGGQRRGRHAETAGRESAATWYFAEGATHSGFELFYLIENPNPVPASVTVNFLRPAPAAPIVRVYEIGPASRMTVWANEVAPELSSAEMSAIIETSPATPIVAERAMYRASAEGEFGAGHASLGATSPANRWFLAEGATGDFFDFFLLIANPDTRTADLHVEYLLPDSTTVSRHYVVSPRSRFTVWVDQEERRLASTAVSVRVESVNDVPVVVERAMWWPGTAATWSEAHAALGATATAPAWVVAGGEAGGSEQASSWLLIANMSPSAVDVDVTMLFEDEPPATRTLRIGPLQRSNVEVAAVFPDAEGRRFGALVEAVDPDAALIVERATYWNAGGRFWSVGAAAAGVPLR